MAAKFINWFFVYKKTSLNILIYDMNILVHNVFRRQQKALKSLNVHQKIGEKLYDKRDKSKIIEFKRVTGLP